MADVPLRNYSLTHSQVELPWSKLIKVGRQASGRELTR